MNIKSLRNDAVKDSISRIEAIMSDGIDIPVLEAAKQIMLELCEKSELFPRDDFPIPDNGLHERTFLIYENSDGGYALYVNSGISGQSSPAHNHGGSWAIVAAIEGEETHRLYVDEGNDTHSETAAIRQLTELVVKPGVAVSMMPDGIHSIHAGNKPLLHLHLYGKSFASQSQRNEYDLDNGTVRRFVLEDIGFIEDAR
jgi:predicted metal-dependent enzyme (double-stranded beta helix superfamily)